MGAFFVCTAGRESTPTFFASTDFPIVEIKAAPPHTPAELPAAIGKSTREGTDRLEPACRSLNKQIAKISAGIHEGCSKHPQACIRPCPSIDISQPCQKSARELAPRNTSATNRLFSGRRRSANDVITARGTDSDIVSRPTPRFRRCGGPEHHGAFKLRNTSP